MSTVPVSPLSPLGPCGPCSPCGPTSPLSPFKFETTFQPDSVFSQTSQSSISKSLIFCIKDSPYNEPKYYEVEITGNNSINDTNSIYTTIDNFTLSDTLT